MSARPSQPVLSGALNLFMACVLTYGALYAAYRYGVPDLGGSRDFFKYEEMIDAPLDWRAVEAPFVLRQLPTLVARGILETGFYYPTVVSFSYFEGFEGPSTQHRFFALIVSNYLAVLLALWFGMQEIDRRLGASTRLESKLAFAMLCTGYFYFSQNVIAPMTEGYGWLGLVLFVIAALHRSVLLVVVACGLLLFSRETALVFILPFASVLAYATWTQTRARRFWVASLVVATLSILAVVAIRSSGWVSGNPQQIAMGGFVGHVAEILPHSGLLFPVVVAQLELALILGILALRARAEAFAALLGLGALLLVGAAAGLSTNLGRILGEPVPALALLAILGTASLGGAYPKDESAVSRASSPG